MEVLAAVALAVQAAIGAYGTSVLTRSEDAAAEATVRVGQSLLQKIFHRAKNTAQIEGAVADLSATPEDEDAQAALRLQLKKALEADPSLSAEVAKMVRASGTTVTNSGDQVNIAHNVLGIQGGPHSTNTQTGR